MNREDSDPTPEVGLVLLKAKYWHKTPVFPDIKQWSVADFGCLAGTRGSLLDLAQMRDANLASLFAYS